MRVLVVHDRYDDALPNGENAVVRWEVEALSAHGIDVRLVETPRDVLGEPRWKRGLASLGGIYAPGWRRDVRREIDAFRPDLVHVHNLWPHATPSVYDACRDTARPVVQTLHNYRIACIADFLSRDGQRCERCLGRRVGWPGLTHRCVEGSAAASAVKMTAIGVHNLLHTWERRVDTFIAMTEAMRATFARAGLPANRIRVKPSCAPDRGASNRERRYFCFAGRLSREKGVEALLDCWSAPGLPELRIAGDGPLAGAVREAAARHCSVSYVGMLAPDGVSELMGGAIATIIPSAWDEPSPVVMMQSFCAATPVIVSDHGHRDESVEHRVTGLVYAAGDRDALRREIAWATTHPEACRAMGATARRRYEERYSTEASRARLLEIYADTLAAAGAGVTAPASRSRHNA
jgi:glycosyltransferase involved in cell wall biosynthesis